MINADWTMHRAAPKWCHQGNIDLYLDHIDGAKALIYPIGGVPGARKGPFRAVIALGLTRDFETRRQALHWIKEHAVGAYIGGPNGDDERPTAVYSDAWKGWWRGYRLPTGELVPLELCPTECEARRLEA